ncbi:MAG: hypothetical protein WAN36_07140, partial [Calditrichia bacterium]
LHLLLLVLVASLSGLDAAPTDLQPQQPPGVVPLFPPDYPGMTRFPADSILFSPQWSKMQREVTLDSTQQRIQVRNLLYGEDYGLPVVMDLDYYVEKRLAQDRQEMLRKTILKNMAQEQQTGGAGIELNIPVRIRSKAFKRIFGGDRVGLRVTGNITFELAGRSENREGSAVSSYEQRGNFSPRFKQTQQFQVEGRVGDKVSVKVDQNSEATFDFENTLRLTYTGDEDEIIQTIEAGNVNLSLPSTNYVSASSKHQGLFGLKTAMQVGNFSFTGIASLQRGEKQKITKTGRADENTFKLKDYEYTRDRFFFVDSVYAANFTKQYNPETMVWQVFGGGDFRIKQLDVWKKVHSTLEGSRSGWAVWDPSGIDVDTLSREIPGEREQGYFIRLQRDVDYGYDEYRGFFWLNQNVNEQDIIAVAYETDAGIKKGMLFNEISDSTDILLKLVRAQGNKSDYPTWQLYMRNVYNLGAAGISKEGFNAKVLYTKTGTDVEVQPVAPTQTFNFLMGLDRMDEQGNYIPGGDKEVDVNNGNIFDFANGYLIFPSTTPFAPTDPDFAIDPSLHVNIYQLKDRTNDQKEHKFDLEITTSSVSSTFNLGF